MSAGQPGAARCIGEPVSWLRLEQLALGELRDGGAAEQHVARCAACAAALAQLRGDTRELPPLVVPALPGAANVRNSDVWSSDVRVSGIRGVNVRNADVRNADVRAADVRGDAAAPWWKRSWTLGGAGLAAALAALLLFVLVRRDAPPDGDNRFAALLHVKGAGDVSVTLVRERDGVITFDPSDVADGDRWKIQLTCAQGGAVWADVAVLQNGLTSHPLSPQRLACGNEVVLPGAFRITGGGAELCVALDDRPPPRTRWRRGERSGTVCRSLVRMP